MLTIGDETAPFDLTLTADAATPVRPTQPSVEISAHRRIADGDGAPARVLLGWMR